MTGVYIVRTEGLQDTEKIQRVFLNQLYPVQAEVLTEQITRKGSSIKKYKFLIFSPMIVI